MENDFLNPLVYDGIYVKYTDSPGYDRNYRGS
jgi:hypothetical protein